VAQNGSEAGSPVAGVAARYASALFELARDERDVDGVAASLDQFDAMLRESPDLRRFVRSPIFTGAEQEAAIVALLEKSGIGGIGGNFIRLAAANRRLFALPDMIRAFRTLVRESKGIVRAEVTVAERPSDAVVEEIKASLRDVARSEIDLDLKIDPSLIQDKRPDDGHPRRRDLRDPEGSDQEFRPGSRSHRGRSGSVRR
jgi:F-type H+-transporting ATPase subunit delta